MIEDLPIDDLGGAAYQAWQRQAADETREDEVFDPCRFSGKATAAAMAAGFGHKDALDAFIKEWDAVMQDPDRRVEAKVFRTQARKLLPILGSLDNLPEWYAEHRDALVYDSNAKTYTLPGD